jgi:hypothetical protein
VAVGQWGKMVQISGPGIVKPGGGVAVAVVLAVAGRVAMAILTVAVAVD